MLMVGRDLSMNVYVEDCRNLFFVVIKDLRSSLVYDAHSRGTPSLREDSPHAQISRNDTLGRR